MDLVCPNNYLAVHLHQLLSEEKGNVFFSPFSISTVMSMALCAAKGETETEMKKALGYDLCHMGKGEIISAFQEQLSEFLVKTDFYTLNCANSVLMQKDFGVKDEYKKALTEAFKALLLEVDFQSDGNSVVSQLNEWVKEKTNNMIPQLIQSLDPETVIVLLNAVYFKGSWFRKFNKESTYKRDFYNGGKEESAKSVDMMRLTESFQYIEKDTFQAIKLPYEGEKFAMLILLPTSKDGLEALEKELTSAFVYELEEEMVTKKVIVNLPRFSLDYSKSLMPCFQRLGVHKLFQIGAELGGASDCPNLCVSEVVHKAVLEVNEEGSEAAAATLMKVLCRKAQRHPEIVADHPFAFAIYDMQSRLILFMGRVEEL